MAAVPLPPINANAKSGGDSELRQTYTTGGMVLNIGPKPEPASAFSGITGNIVTGLVVALIFYIVSQLMKGK